MNTVDIIIKKRDGREISEDEIRYIVDGYTSGAIPDYQMSAFLMAVYFRGMNDEETICLTKTMRDSITTWSCSMGLPEGISWTAPF